MLAFVPRLLNQVLPALSSDIEQVRLAASRVNNSLMNYIMSLAEEPSQKQLEDTPATTATSTRPQSMPPPASSINAYNVPNIIDIERRDSNPPHTTIRGNDRTSLPGKYRGASPLRLSTRPGTPAQEIMILDYEASVAALTLQFLNENEATRVAALSWLLMLQRRAPRKVNICFRHALSDTYIFLGTCSTRWHISSAIKDTIGHLGYSCDQGLAAAFSNIQKQ